MSVNELLRVNANANGPITPVGKGHWVIKARRINPYTARYQEGGKLHVKVLRKNENARRH